MTDTIAASDFMNALGTATLGTSNGWRTLNETDTFTTVGRTATTWENGHLVGAERQQLTVFSDGEVLFYYRDDTALLQGIVGGGWERLRDTDSILTVVSQPARTDHIEY